MSPAAATKPKQHGTATRSRTCRCTKCCAYRNNVPHSKIRRMPERHWPLRPLELQRFGRLADHFGAEQVETWRNVGLTDSEADKVATFFHSYAGSIWMGWIEAGLDYEDD